MDFRRNIEKKLGQILNKLKSINAVKSYKLNISWASKEDIDAKIIKSLSELDAGLCKCLQASKPRRAEIRNVISELVKKKNVMDSRSETSDSDLSKPEKTVKVSNSRGLESTRTNENHEDVKTFLCEYCGKQFLHMSAWKYHLLNVHRGLNDKSDSKSENVEKKKPKFECDICSKIFSVLKNLESHKVTHDLRHECSRCSEKFRTKSQLNCHVKSFHPRERKTNQKCKFCNHLSFDSRVDLENHIAEEHPKERRWSRKSAESHVCTYAGCGKTFKHARSLRSHAALSHDARKATFTCDVCDKSFFEKGKLNRHLLCHQDGTAFECDSCRKTFSRRDALKRHVSISHPDKKDVKSFRCKFCDKAFSLKHNRDVHEENVHVSF